MAAFSYMQTVTKIGYLVVQKYQPAVVTVEYLQQQAEQIGTLSAKRKITK